MNGKHIFAAALAVAVASGCASNSKDISTQYVSPLQYKDYECDSLAMEMSRVSRRVGELQASIDKNAKQDKVATGVGLVLFWPALFFIDGDTPEAAEYARLKGEFEAMQTAANQKKCSIDVQQG
ncbi:hypothetical protein K3217_14785 [bacterium BD-1]|uniref:hypothetical protein n=1 Tax=Arenimonas sp. TaxID=1872635 RepID=UPI001E42E8FC|nr:hypothetical protein [Ottowia caeni]